jgi:hypothetical protein
MVASGAPERACASTGGAQHLQVYRGCGDQYHTLASVARPDGRLLRESALP